MPKQTAWRDFEKLVARIEQDLAPKGAVVKSPDRLLDLVTGKRREVDASIRFQIGSTPILITVECRKRRGVQDDTWIEQLATKRAKIGAAKTIAVSSRGFSDSARKTAQLHGIELRTLEDRIGEEIVKQFFAGFKLQLIMTEYQAKTITFELEDGTVLDRSQFGDALLAALDEDTPHGVLARDVTNGQVVTADWILQGGIEKAFANGGSAVTVKVRADFEPKTVQVVSKSGGLFLKAIELDAEFWRRVIPAPPTSLLEYSSLDGPIRRTVKARAEISETETIELSVDMDSPALNRVTGGKAGGSGE